MKRCFPTVSGEDIGRFFGSSIVNGKTLEIGIGLRR